MTYLYIKKLPSQKRTKKLSRPKRKFFAITLFIFGIFLFASAILPIIQFQLEYSTKFNQILNPLSTKYYNQSGNILGSATDFTQLDNWFAPDYQGIQTTVTSPVSPGNSVTYSISIPKLKIDRASVALGSMDLKKTLVQYPQTALPGQLGNSVIFGHSVLPQFFNPKSYITIFSTLFRLKQGDEIYVNYDDIQYKYLVEEMFEVQPTDLSVLEQRFDGKYLTLITCSPPGTYLRRLIIKSRIVDI
ncbi:MAG: sortase [Candidatus Shapirobacteria bacterium]|jgi:sortase A